MGKHAKLSKVLAVVLSLCICLSATAFMSFAYDENFVSETHEVFSRTTSTIAPGVTQDIVYAYANDGKQMAYYVATADITRDDVDVYANYMNNQCTEFGMAKLTEQMAAAQLRNTTDTTAPNYNPYYTVVAGANADFYNMNTGRPSGAFVMEGTITNNANNRPFFAILDDGTPIIGKNNTDWAAISDRVQEAVGGSQVLVKDGVDVTANVSGDYNTDRHCRTCVGYTEDGKVVIMSLDGRQEPFSCGGSMHELAQIMLEAGCVAAINLDGGGSTTFAARQEGENEVSIVNRPSDGSERAISSSLMIVSTTPPSDVFDRAVLTAENTYVTPGSTVNVTATGVSPAGTAAEIPAEAVWQLADSAMGTVENGVFVSNGTVGEAVVELVYNGEVVGSVTINVVIPDIVFDSASMTVPYNKTFKLKVSATTNGGMNKVVLKDSDVVFELSDPAMGTVNGAYYTSCDASTGLTGGSITAKFVYDETKTSTATITFGKASVIAEDFEDQDISGWSAGSAYARAGKGHATLGRFERASVALVDSESGKVRNGDYALELTANFAKTTAAGYKAVKYTFPAIDLTGATSFGMWMYLPVNDVHNLEFDIGGYEYYIEDDANVGEEGWYYIQAPASSVGSSVSTFTIYMTDPDETYFNIYNIFKIYIDDLTIDYSNATEDREIPVFTKATVVTGLDREEALAGQTLNENVITVKAYSAENLSGNYTGLNLDTARVYVDGFMLAEEDYTCDEKGIITVGDIALNNGTHTFRFEIDDNAGNTGFITKQIVINEANSGVYLARRSNDVFPLAGSIDYYDVIAKNIENVESISMAIDLDTINSWELQGADVAYGFEMEYTVDDFSNTATIKLTKVDDVELEGEAVIAALPVRIWQTDSYLDPIFVEAGVVTSNPSATENTSIFTPEAMWHRDSPRLIQVEMSVLTALTEYADGTYESNTGSPIVVITEHNRYRAAGYYTADGEYVTGDPTFCQQGKESTHVHTATAIEDKAATCTTAGYTGRTFCAECNSVVEWGTIVPATGHSYEVTDGVLKCACGKVYNGEYEGKLYIDGIAAEGWVEDSYYVDGVALTGIQLVDDLYYDFGEDGVSKGKYNGLYDNGENIYYIGNGAIMEGWRLIGDDYWFFSWDGGAAADGEALIDGYNYKFVDHKLVEGEWINDGKGLKYRWAGSFVKNQWFELNGNTYYFGEYEYASTGLSILRLGSNSADRAAYMFTDEGVLVERIMGDGLKTFDNGAVYLENDVATYAGLVQDADGNYYYINSSLQAVKNRSYVIGDSKANGLLPAGTYEFGADGKMLNPPVDEPEEPTVKNGLYTDEDGEIRYYVDGEATYAGVVADAEGNLYYINSTKKAVKNCTYKIGASRTNGLCDAGSYEFGADGKMIIPEVVKNGLIIDEDGEIRYYVNNEATYAGVVADAEGNLYYINSTKKAVKNCTYKIGASRTNGLCDAGTYEFGADGKMIIDEEEPTAKNGLVVDEDGEIRYYVDGESTYAGVVADAEGNLYYINSTKKAVKNCTYKIGASRTNGLCDAGTYEFGADGKMIIA